MQYRVHSFIVASLPSVFYPSLNIGPSWRATLITWIAAILLSGCYFTSEPPANAGFDHIEHLNDLDGIYQNLGEGGPDTDTTYLTDTIYLSEIIWPDAVVGDHLQIERIEVRTIDAGSVAVTAFGWDSVVKKQENFVEGEDFTLNDGIIQMHRDVSGILSAKVGAVAVFSQGVELGIDKTGHGKYGGKGSHLGTVFVVIPVAGGARDDVRFERLSD